MRFIHISDVHYKMKPDLNKSWTKQREEDVSSSLYKIVQKIKNDPVELLLIAGDLFHKQALNKDIKELNYLFSTIGDTQVVIIAGNHDYLDASSPIINFKWADNVHYILSSSFIDLYLPTINTTITTFSYNNYELKEDITGDIHPKNKHTFNILMLHGGDANHLPFDKNKLVKLGFNYYALGHIHKPEILFDKLMAYPGSLEPLNKNETGKHGYILGEVDDTTHTITNLQHIFFASRQYINLKLNLKPNITNMQLISMIENAINKYGTDNIYTLFLEGSISTELDINLSYLLSSYKIMDIIDKTSLDYNLEHLYSLHKDDIIGYFIKTFSNEQKTSMEEKALNYGISALLSCSNERN